MCVRCRTRLRVPTWPRCVRCHHPRGTGRADEPDCLECRSWPEALTAARYAFALEAPATDLVHALKYEGWRELATFIAGAMARVCSEALSRRLIVPIPTTRQRLRQRGYNQAELIATRLAELRDVPMYRALQRRDGGLSQTALKPAERRDNVQGVFTPVSGAARPLRGAHVLLVDDVLTTGATAGEAASTLAAVGAASVTLIAFARALPSRSMQAA